MPIFKKIFSRQKWRPVSIFEFFARIAKHKNAYISKTLLDRASFDEIFDPQGISAQ